MEPLSKVNPTNSVFHTQRNIVHATESYEYSMIQGNLGNNYDLIVAVRQKGGNVKIPDSLSKPSNKTVSDKLPRESSKDSELSYTEPKKKVMIGIDLVKEILDIHFCIFSR